VIFCLVMFSTCRSINSVTTMG